MLSVGTQRTLARVSSASATQTLACAAATISGRASESRKAVARLIGKRRSVGSSGAGLSSTLPDRGEGRIVAESLASAAGRGPLRREGRRQVADRLAYAGVDSRRRGRRRDGGWQRPVPPCCRVDGGLGQLGQVQATPLHEACDGGGHRRRPARARLRRGRRVLRLRLRRRGLGRERGALDPGEQCGHDQHPWPDGTFHHANPTPFTDVPKSAIGMAAVHRVAGGGPLPTGGRNCGRAVSTGWMLPGGRRYAISLAG